MKFTDLFIKRPVLAIVVSLLIFFVGLRSVSNLQIRQYPQFDSTSISVTTTYPGASPDLMQGFITTPIEQAIASAEGIDYMVASSTQSQSRITVYIKLNYSPDRAMVDVMSKVQQVKSKLPRQSNDPIVLKANTQGQPVIFVMVQSAELSLTQASDFINRVVVPVFSTVDGVAQVGLLGGQTFAMRLWVDPERIAARGLTGADVSNAALPFMAARRLEVGTSEAIVARLSLTGELGYEITVPAAEHRALWHALVEAGTPHGMCQLGGRALECLRIEKGYGIWSMEFTQAYTPAMCGLDRYIDRDKGDFIGRAALLAAPPPAQRLAMIEIDALDADARGFEPIWVDDTIVGYVTSGAYGHHVGKSLALAYLDVAVIDARPPLTVHVVGERRTARLLAEPPYDPTGSRLRA